MLDYVRSTYSYAVSSHMHYTLLRIMFEALWHEIRPQLIYNSLAVDSTVLFCVLPLASIDASLHTDSK